MRSLRFVVRWTTETGKQLERHFETEPEERAWFDRIIAVPVVMAAKRSGVKGEW